MYFSLDLVCLVSDPQGKTVRQTHSGATECLGGCSVPQTFISSRGMVFKTFNLLEGSLTMFQPQVDLFATRWNHKLPDFVSLAPDPLAWDRDAFSLDWSKRPGYAYPFFGFLQKVLLKVREQPCQLLLIAPLRPSAPWFPLAVELSTDTPCLIPFSPDLLVQSHNHHVSGNRPPSAGVVSRRPRTVKEVTSQRKDVMLQHSVSDFLLPIRFSLVKGLLARGLANQDSASLVFSLHPSCLAKKKKWGG